MSNTRRKFNSSKNKEANYKAAKERREKERQVKTKSAYRTRVKACNGKIPYATIHLAYRYLQEWLYNRPDLDPYSFCIYLCKYCKEWHVGTTNWNYLEYGSYTDAPKKDSSSQIPIFRKTKSKIYRDYNENVLEFDSSNENVLEFDSSPMEIRPEFQQEENIENPN